MTPDSFPTVLTPAGPQHTFLALAPVVAPPFRWEVQKADIQEFDPAKAPAQPALDLFSLLK